MAKIKVLKDNNEIVYPQTVAEAVAISGGSSLEELLSAMEKKILDKQYPIGSVYMSATLSTAESVHNALGGTWEVWGSGRVPVGVNTSDSDFNTPNKTGGEKTHKLTESEMPSHNHSLESVRFRNAWTASGTGSGNWLASSAYYWGANEQYNDIPLVGSIKSTGGSSAHNNLQPYITCYMYKRVA